MHLLTLVVCLLKVQFTEEEEEEEEVEEFVTGGSSASSIAGRRAQLVLQREVTPEDFAHVSEQKCIYSARERALFILHWSHLMQHLISKNLSAFVLRSRS